MKRVRGAVRGIAVYFAACALGYELVDVICRLMLRTKPQFDYMECAQRVGECWLGAVVLAVFVAVWGYRASLRSQLFLAAVSGVASGAAVLALVVTAVVLDALDSSMLLKICCMGAPVITAGAVSTTVAYFWLGWHRRRMLLIAKDSAAPRDAR